MQSIAQSSASISTWRGERLALTFLAPINLSKPARVLNQPCPENISFSFQEPSLKHHFPGIDGRVAASMCGTALYMFNICASAQSVDSIYANLSVFLRSMSKWKLCYSFLSRCTIESMQTDDHPFAGELCRRDDPCLRRESLLGKWLDLMVSFKGPKSEVLEDIQKNPWFIDSSSALHLAQHTSPCIPLGRRFFLTAIHPDTNYHKKCFIFGGHHIFQKNAFNTSNVGPNNRCGFYLSR